MKFLIVVTPLSIYQFISKNVAGLERLGDIEYREIGESERSIRKVVRSPRD